MRLVLRPFLLSFLLAVPALAQPLPRAHAHNDYEHPRPLLDALAHGFCSVEADVHLVDGALLVAHDRGDVVPGRTLQALYLEPLRARAAAGPLCGPGGPPLLLLVDVKSDAESTYAALREALAPYAGLLTHFGGTVREGAVTVVVSGNRARATMAAEPERLAAYDGRLPDLQGEPLAPASFMPLVSAPWSDVASWHGDGPLSEATRTRVADAVARAHAQGRRLRFWGTPDHPAVWQLLFDAGVDLINTDDLPGLAAFLRTRR